MLADVCIARRLSEESDQLGVTFQNFTMNVLPRITDSSVVFISSIALE